MVAQEIVPRPLAALPHKQLNLFPEFSISLEHLLYKQLDPISLSELNNVCTRSNKYYSDVLIIIFFPSLCLAI